MEQTSCAVQEPYRELNMEEADCNNGQLKIFFGYSAGAGKSYAMLQAAHKVSTEGVDVVVGCTGRYEWPETEALLDGFEQLPARVYSHDGKIKEDFDLDAALQRHPEMIIVDGLSHTNIEGSRHAKRFQDIEELLKEGIDVYTTINVQNIESLRDMVFCFTGLQVEECIPDSVFDKAAQVELIDIEPQELLERLRQNPQPAAQRVSFEQLTALRELALRRCADRVTLLLENARKSSTGGSRAQGRILVCLSSSASNAKVIRAAARIAGSFHSPLSALFVQTSDFLAMDDESRETLYSNIRLADRLGAKIETVCGEDIAYQITEFARQAGASTVIVGRSRTSGYHRFGRTGLSERLLHYLPELDIYIIPDIGQKKPHDRREAKSDNLALSAVNFIKSIGILALSTVIGLLFERFGINDANIIMVYILGVLVTSVVTSRQIYCIFFSALSVLVFNFFFTEPLYSLIAYDKEYPITFLIMFVAALFTGSLAARLKKQSAQSAQAAYRTKILFDTNQLLERASGPAEITDVSARQLLKLLRRDIVVYESEEGGLKSPKVFYANGEKAGGEYAGATEREAAAWVYKNNEYAGAMTDTFSDAKCIYLPVHMNRNVYGVVGIAAGEEELDVFENSILLSILGEMAMALESEYNRQQKEAAAVEAQNERLRANLLRTISHDLRTPLTSISGNASNLLSNADRIDEETKQCLYGDIYDDALWLINLVENLLSVTRIEESSLNLRIQTELMEEIIEEAISHMNRISVDHHLKVENSENLIFVKADAGLIVQVLINLVNNAIKYTQIGSTITIKSERKENWVVVTVSDDGPGIPEEVKSHAFEMFYTGEGKVSDGRRGMGLGLFLCRSIVYAHGGDIHIMDNKPKGTVLQFTLPAGEVQLYE